MSSRRKSSTPCMIRVGDALAEDDVAAGDVAKNVSLHPQHLLEEDWVLMRKDEESVSGEETGKEREEEEETDAKASQKQQSGGYECKYCPFSTQNLSDFKEHVDGTHPNVILNPLYLCTICNFSTKKFDSLSDHNETVHPGENNFKFKRLKLNNQTVLEQTIEGTDGSTQEPQDTEDTQGGEGFDSFPSHNSATGITDNLLADIPLLLGNCTENQLENQLENILPKDQITAVNVNGTIIIPDPTMLQGLSHVSPLLQRPPNFNSVPKIAVPLNTTKYNPLLDNNATLIASFNKFPYPTHAELSWLTAVSKHPEEQIKVWFTTQRLKQGITWSPEEVEEARKKMFNGSIPPTHQTYTVLPVPVSQPDKASQPSAQKVFSHVTGQSRLVSATSSNGLTVTCTTVTVTTANQAQALKRSLMSSSTIQEVKRPMVPQTDGPKEKLRMAPPPVPSLDRLPMPPPPVPPEIKRTMAPSLVAPEVKRPIVAPMGTSKGKLPMAFPIVTPKDKLPMVAPPLLPKDRLSMTPIVSSDLKRPLAASEIRSLIPAAPSAPKDKLSLSQSLLAPDLKLPMAPPLVPPQMKRPSIIHTAWAPSKVPSFLPTLPLQCKASKEPAEQKPVSIECRLSESHNANGVPRGDVKNLSTDQSTPSRNGSNRSNNDVAPKERPKTVPTQFPLLERVKGKTTEQLKILEESFQRHSFPTYSEVDQLVAATRLSREEIDSWFIERRALRDNLEQALLNSMGSKKMDSVTEKRHQHSQHQHGILNGVHKPGALPMNILCPIVAPSSPVPLDIKTLNLLKEVFVRTRWPSPEEYNQLEMQTGLARTDLVRWFKDSRLALRSGALEWKELFHKLSGSGQNGHGEAVSSEQSGTTHSCQERKEGRMEDTGRLRENAKPSSQEIKDWFTSTLNQNMMDVGQNGEGRKDCGNWLKDTVRSQELVSDTD
ncbi:zinc fingers and homeoboxes protein 2 [Chanos chanos]|uniref:Zinc fingers and homeoboxes protein 2 n=1 Tax=Chanos chanos TaxID=29144 RepID=A0A6J2WP30_CHACN|nr:zinc fingers and homeoboxes protein 2-like [Chanos chanos]